MNREIFEYVVAKVDGKKQKVGILYACKNPAPLTIDEIGSVCFGWSKANVKKDKFDKDKGLNIAISRSNSTSFITPPLSMKLHRVNLSCKPYQAFCK